MKEIISEAENRKIGNMQNGIIRKSMAEKIEEDKVIKIIAKETADFIKDLFNSKVSNKKL